MCVCALVYVLGYHVPDPISRAPVTRRRHCPVTRAYRTDFAKTDNSRFPGRFAAPSTTIIVRFGGPPDTRFRVTTNVPPPVTGGRFYNNNTFAPIKNGTTRVTDGRWVKSRRFSPSARAFNSPRTRTFCFVFLFGDRADEYCSLFVRVRGQRRSRHAYVFI